MVSKDHHPALDDPNAFVYYRYAPSLAAAAIFVALFGISSLLHIWQTWRKKSWFMTPFIIGALFEFVGYIGRILSSQDQWDRNAYIIQTLLLLLGPALFAATIYMILGRIILLTDGEKFSLIRRTWLTKIFVGGDVLSFVIQGAGGGVMSSADKNPGNMKKGENMIIGGLFVQLFFFGFFVVTSAVFQYRGRAHLNKLPKHIVWKKHIYVLYLTSTFILIRSVFRVVEYLQGNNGELLRKEVFLYVFDAVLMLAVAVSMNVVHPGDLAILIKQKLESAYSTDSSAIALDDGRRGVSQGKDRANADEGRYSGHV
ncbi:RTA1-domain-containing protein [Aaosphaeria arxii CBS 175.79]|uniref:RTA1-domain-containing protein n=1 Tax=Aaosphaeria arxii CBS 175.79 TaxID=1450172 RepID=A0A6A5Y167_9PLEO|nr:RTA1-domain-containing protein [Aaosphaeria arxii CBS 175.79]KAF2018817.1 RTA1-domain-containing protein [Aaosphaeria arxii CBS 175.79]